MSKFKFIFASITTLFCIMIFSGCGEVKAIPENPKDIVGLTFVERTDLMYAEEFAIDRYQDGYSVIYTAEGVGYLLVPNGREVPKNLDGNMKVITTPVENVYMAATSVMGLFDDIGSGSAVKFSGTKADGWYIEYAKNALNSGDMLYAGKYSEPDYELLVSNDCPLAIESTMIEHSPDVKEKLDELGITVFTDYSSYESHPLGRSEWIKVYGEMLGESEEADRLFNEQAEKLNFLDTSAATGKTAVFFYVNNSGQAVTRKSGDYVTKMIELAGGENVFKNLGGDGFSTVTLEWEEFYSTAKDADFIIYNSTIGGEISTLDELISKNGLIADFKAVKDGNVWCTKNNLYQETMKLGTVISDFNAVFTGNYKTSPPEFLYKLESGDSNE